MTEDSDINEILSFYNSYDHDKDGLINFGEFSKLINALGGKPTEEQIRAGFELVDTDKNGYIDFNEFSEWWGNH